MLGACDTGEPRQAGPGRRSGADLSASGPQVAKAEARVRDTTVWSVRRANLSASTLIPAHTGSSGRPLVPMVGPPRWAVDSVGGTKPANPSGLGFLRGALPGRVLFPGVGVVGAERRRAGQRFRVDDCYGWPSGASHDRTAPRVGKRGAPGQHVSVDVSVLLLGTLLSFSAHSFLIGWLLEYSVMLV